MKRMKRTSKENTAHTRERRKRARKRFIEKHPFCVKCGSTENLTIDHLIPKFYIKQRHNQSNWQVLCYQCNHSKHSKLIKSDIEKSGLSITLPLGIKSNL